MVYRRGIPHGALCPTWPSGSKLPILVPSSGNRVLSTKRRVRRPSRSGGVRTLTVPIGPKRLARHTRYTHLLALISGRGSRENPEPGHTMVQEPRLHCDPVVLGRWVNPECGCTGDPGILVYSCDVGTSGNLVTLEPGVHVHLFEP